MSAHDMAQNTAAQLRALGDPCPARKHWPAAKTNHTGNYKMQEDIWPVWFHHASCFKESGDIKLRLLSYRRTLEFAHGGDSFSCNLVAGSTCMTKMKSGLGLSVGYFLRLTK
jgi:hypothetical protein